MPRRVRRPSGPPLPFPTEPERRADLPELTIYTDGACSGNPGPGGWAAVLVRGSEFAELGGFEALTTNNRMEMRAAIEGLRRAGEGENVHVVTDSKYLHDGISRWIRGWKRKGWRKADGAEVLNRDLWEELDALVSRPGTRVTWEHVRGHAGHVMNERCDVLATGFARGGAPELRSGDGSWIQGATGVEPTRSSPRTPSVFPCYLSLLGGQVACDATWAACEARVKGARGARYRKVRSETELQETLRGWGVET